LIGCQFVYQALSEAQKNQVLDFWQTSGLVPEREAVSRVNQVACVLSVDQQFAGVITVYPGEFAAPGLVYFFVRMAIVPSLRGHQPLRKYALQTLFHRLKQQYAPQIQGLVFEQENPKLARLGETTEFFQKRGYLYHGKSARGLQLWYVRFDEPRGIFAEACA